MTVQNSNRASGAAVGFAIAVALFVIITLVAKLAIRVPAVDADHGATISAALADLRTSENKSLNTTGWVDQAHGVVRLPIDAAIQKAAQLDAGQIRDELKTRAEAAAASLPVAPPKPSAFE